MKNWNIAWMIPSLVMIVTAGCGRAPSNSPVPSSNESAASVDGAKYLLAAQPAEAKDLLDVRKNAKNEDEVVVIGRIGGSENPWVEGRAAFTIVDTSLKACSDIPGDACPIPWDYCCEMDKLPKSKALVKIVDESGELVKTDARGLLNVKELQTVVVRGKAQRDDAGNLTVLATGVYVNK